MNSLNDWCRMASLVCCLILGIEGFTFVHDLATQARSIAPGTVAVEKPHHALGQEIAKNS